MKTIAVYSRRIAFELQKKGFIVVRTVPNWKFPQYQIYLFLQTPEFMEEWRKLTTNPIQHLK